MKPDQTKDASGSKSVLARQMIVSLVAVGIMGLGVWSLLGQEAPYHPDGINSEVTRYGMPELTTVND